MPRCAVSADSSLESSASPSFLFALCAVRSHVTVAWPKCFLCSWELCCPSSVYLLEFGTAFQLLFVAFWLFERCSAVTPTPLHAELVMRGARPCGQPLLQRRWLVLLARQCRAVSASGHKSVRVPRSINGLSLVCDGKSKAQR